ncbi:microprocessor complex subunit DGCR8 [Culicoides brevitarsis]|uniref:microprocessor complex subunit DGCR8 n=1 Tax=Culicoides brevitarsis TaxID=469753 RepID=UPI00307BF4E1
MNDGENVECPMMKRQKVFQNDMNADDHLKESLKEFHVLDEVDGDEDVSENEDITDGSEDDDFSENEDIEADIENMLDADLPEEMKSKRKENTYEEKFKTVLDEKGRNHFEVLPEGWLQATHNSGIPIYLHKTSRVCTTSKPYFLGPGSVRKHEIPLSAIPCLNYRKALEEEFNLSNELQKNIENESLPKDTVNNISNVPLPLPNARIETVNENDTAKSLSSEQVQEYCKKLFKFRTIRVMRFKSWSARRKFTKNRKNIKHLKRPTLPDGTKLITFPVVNTGNENASNSRPKKEWIMNPNGKSYVCILHEYVQHALKKQPTYEFKELDNAATPYSATVSINDLKYGTGFGSSKKQAKSEAARETLEILIPGMRDKITSAANDKGSSSSFSVGNDLSVFDEIKIEDPRVAEFCAKTTEPSPHAILLTCLQRNFGLADVQIKYDINTLKHKKNEFTMTVGKHTTTVICKNKRDGKQRASQAILQILHPHIQTWGSLLRLYGNHSVKSFKEKKQEEQEITVLQSKAAINQPNYAILEKLKLEMSRLNERRNAIVPIGKFKINTELPKSSGSNLKNVNL